MNREYRKCVSRRTWRFFSPLPSCDNVSGKFSINAKIGSINLRFIKYMVEFNFCFVSVISFLLFYSSFISRRTKRRNKIFQTLEGQTFLSPFSFSFLHSFFFELEISSLLRISMLFQGGDETEDYLNAIKEKIKAQERI